MEIKNLVKTCNMCPSQWEFKTYENRTVYVRYRHGILWVSISEPNGSVDDAIDGPDLIREKIGDDLDGTIEWEEIEQRIKDLPNG